MKYLFTFLILFTTISVEAQYNLEYHVNFDTIYSSYSNFDRLEYVSYQNFITIDTTTYHNNTWQIGHPNKAVFDSAHSNPNAIVTDTALSCIPNDTSVFMMKVPKAAWLGLRAFTFFYKLDKDSGDIAMIEMSPDTGLHWINVLTDTLNTFDFLNGKPNLSTSSIGWVNTFIFVGPQTLYSSPDSFLFRFTFITDSSSAARDGWMLDDFMMGYEGEGVKNINQNLSFDLYPNPANKQLIIKHKLQEAVTVDVVLMNSIGK